MATFTRSITVNAPVGRIYEFFSKPENMKAINPRAIKVWDLKPLSNGGYVYRWNFNMIPGVVREVASENTELVPNESISTRNTCGMRGKTYVVFDETIKFAADGQMTTITSTTTNNVSIPVIGPILAQVQIRMLGMAIDKSLRNLKTKMENRML